MIRERKTAVRYKAKSKNRTTDKSHILRDRRKSYSSFDELNIALFQYINGFYNSLRPHSHNNGLSPNQTETSFY